MCNVTVQRTRHGTWQVRWRDVTGRQCSRSFKTKRQADAFDDEVHVDTRRGLHTVTRRSRHTVATFAEVWLAGAHNLREGGRDLYRRDLDRHILPALGPIPLARLTRDDIDAFLTDRARAGHAPSSIHRYWRTLRRLCNVAVESDELVRSPMRKVRAPFVPRTEMRFLSADRLEALAEAAWTRDKDGKLLVSYRAMVLVAGWGGLRWSELVGLRPDQLRPDGISVVTQLIGGRRWEEPKGTGRRFVSMPASVMGLVEPMSAGLVFASPSGRPVNHSNWRQRVLVPALAEAGVEPGFRPHDLRHTAVALAIAAGAHPKAIQARMGHSSIQVTLDRYGHLFEGLDSDLAVDLDAMRTDGTTP